MHEPDAPVAPDEPCENPLRYREAKLHAGAVNMTVSVLRVHTALTYCKVDGVGELHWYAA